MKEATRFKEFLRDTVNLNDTRLAQLEVSVSALKEVIRDSAWKPKLRRFEGQGSWANDTIIKPVDQGEYDADLLVMVDPVEGWGAGEYVRSLGREFSNHGTYADKTKVWEYCVTITYANERKVDLAPCVLNRKHQGSIEVCDRKNEAFVASEPTEFTKWLKDKNSLSGSNSFRKVTRLLKYLRDIKETFRCPSVLLTTLLGNEISWVDSLGSEFEDVPTALKTLIDRLDDRLQANATKPKVCNPKLATEDFADAWTDDQYTTFRNVIHRYRGWIDEAFAEEDSDQSIQKWRRVFGDEFAKGYNVVAKAAVSESFADVIALLRTGAAHVSALVDKVKDFGIGALPSGFSNVAHMQTPAWPNSAAAPRTIRVVARWQAYKASSEGHNVTSGDVLAGRGGLWFEALDAQWSAIPEGYHVQWRVTNTGEVAMALGAGRGGFNSSTRGASRWEELAYRGVHITEAFVIDTRSGSCVGRSQPFYVVVE